MPGIARESWLKAAQPSSITKGFGVSGVFPFIYEIFTDVQYPGPVPYFRNEIISTVILLPSAESLKKGCCQLQVK